MTSSGGFHQKFYFLIYVYFMFLTNFLVLGFCDTGFGLKASQTQFGKIELFFSIHFKVCNLKINSENPGKIRGIFISILRI